MARDVSNSNSSQPDSKFNGQVGGKPENRPFIEGTESLQAEDQETEHQNLEVLSDTHAHKSFEASQCSNNHLGVRAVPGSLKSNSCQISSAHSEAVQDNPLVSLIK